MSSAQVHIEMTADEAKAWASMQKLTRGLSNVEAGLSKMGKRAREAAKEHNVLERAAKRVWKENAAPIERYKAKVAELSKTLGRAGVTTEHVQKATAKAHAEYVKESAVLATASQQTDRFIEKQKELARIAERSAQKHRDLGRAAKQVWREGQTPLERYTRRMRDLSVMIERTGMSQETYRRAVVRAREEMDSAGKAGKRAFGPQALSMIKGLVGAAGLGSVAGAVMVINRHYDTWLQNSREISAEARKASNEIVAFAALQEGGTKRARVMAADRLARSYGVHDRGESFNTVQSLQSAYGGDFDKGMKGAAVVFAAKQLGVAVETGTELEVLGAAQGFKPGVALRKAYIAGEESARRPEIIGRAMSGLKYWDDKDVGFAAAAVLAGSGREDQLTTYLKRGGMALSRVGGLQEYFEEAGLGEASRLERLKYLKTSGVTSLESLEEVGLTEVREREAVRDLVNNIDNMTRIQGIIRAKATPGLFYRERREVEDELPMMRYQRRIDQLAALYQSEQAFDRGETAMRVEMRDRARGIAAKRLGLEKSFLFGSKLVDEEGRMSSFQAFRGRVETWMGPQPGPGGRDMPWNVPWETKSERFTRLPAETDRVLEELQAMDVKIAETNRLLEKQNTLTEKQNTLTERQIQQIQRPALAPPGDR